VPPLCSHFAALAAFPARPARAECPECVRLGDTWVHLRQCLSCGHVGCCDSSKNRHATKHHRATGHPLIRSLEPGDEWGWCYVHEEGFDPLPAAPR